MNATEQTTEQLFNELIERLYNEAQPNEFNFTHANRMETLAVLSALKGFHTEDGTTSEQNALLRKHGMMH